MWKHRRCNAAGTGRRILAPIALAVAGPCFHGTPGGGNERYCRRRAKILGGNDTRRAHQHRKAYPTTVAPILAQKFTEDELRQIIAILESPVKAKFEATVPELQKALGEKLAAESAKTINPKLETLKQEIGTRMRTAITP